MLKSWSNNGQELYKNDEGHQTTYLTSENSKQEYTQHAHSNQTTECQK